MKDHIAPTQIPKHTNKIRNRIDRIHDLFFFSLIAYLSKVIASIAFSVEILGFIIFMIADNSGFSYRIMRKDSEMFCLR